MMNLRENMSGRCRRIRRSARRTCARGARGQRPGQYDYNDMDELNSSRRAAERVEEYAYQYDEIGNRISSICRRDVVIGHFITKRRFHFNVLDVVIDLILLS